MMSLATCLRRRSVSAPRPRPAALSCCGPSMRWKTGWRTPDAPPHRRRLPPGALRRDPGACFGFHHRQGQRTGAEDLVVERADVEAVAQRLFGFRAQRLDLELTQLVRERL